MDHICCRNLRKTIENLKGCLDNMIDDLQIAEAEDAGKARRVTYDAGEMVETFDHVTEIFVQRRLEPLLTKIKVNLQPYPPYSTITVYTYLEGVSPWEFTLKSTNLNHLTWIHKMLERFMLSNARDLLVSPSEIKPGALYACDKIIPFRGLSLGIQTLPKLNFLCIDTEIVRQVDISDVYHLPSLLTSFPAQTIRCTLGKEKWLKNRWSEKLSHHFDNRMKTWIFNVNIIDQISLVTPPRFLVDLKVKKDLTEDSINLTDWYKDSVLPALMYHDKEDNEKSPQLIDPFHHLCSHSNNLEDFLSGDEGFNEERQFITGESLEEEQSIRTLQPTSEFKYELAEICSTDELGELLEEEECTRTLQPTSESECEDELAEVCSTDDDLDDFISSPDSEEKHVEVKATYILSEGHFYAQIKKLESEDIISTMEHEFNTIQQQQFLGDEIPSEGQMILALASDEKWRRAIVTNTKGIIISVKFIDYGIESEVLLSNTRKLNSKYSVESPKAKLCLLHNVNKEWNRRDKLKLRQYLLGKSLSATIKLREPDKYHLAIVNGEGKLINDLILMT